MFKSSLGKHENERYKQLARRERCSWKWSWRWLFNSCLLRVQRIHLFGIQAAHEVLVQIEGRPALLAERSDHPEIGKQNVTPFPSRGRVVPTCCESDPPA